MSYKRMIIVLSVAMIVIIVCLFGASYAYYSLTNASTSFSTTTAENDDIAVVYEQSQYINTTTGIPISSDEVAGKASSSRFSALAGSNLVSYQVAIQIDLVDIAIANELKISDFKLQLLENGTVIANKTGADIGSNTSLTLKSMSTITVGTTYNYELRVWLNETGQNQNTLMNKNFSGRIEVSSAMKK